MPKVNVYLPDQLADGVRRHGIPLSQVCQRALEDEIAKRDVRAAVGEAQLKAAARRLKASRERADEERRAQSRRLGRKWALEDAEAPELAELADTVRLVGYQGDDWYFRDREQWPTLAEWLEQLWREGLWRLNLDAFVAGALEAWAQVSAEIERWERAPHAGADRTE